MSSNDVESNSYELRVRDRKLECNKLRHLMAYFQLNYGAFDLILTSDGHYIFLEINSVGEFYWLEKHAGLLISQVIADTLLKKSPP